MEQLVVAAEGLAGHVARVLGHGAPKGQATGHPTGDREEPSVGSAPARSVERSHLGRCRGDHGGHRGARHQRFVDVEHVELLVAQGADGAQGTAGVGGDRGDRTVGGQRHAIAQRCHADVGRRPVARAEDARRVPHGPQRTCQPQNLALHAAGNGEAVRTDQADSHCP